MCMPHWPRLKRRDSSRSSNPHTRPAKAAPVHDRAGDVSRNQTLYRLFNADDELLYIGITQRQMVRFHQHSRDKGWWSEVARIRIEHYPTREDVERAERDAIRSEKPRYNIVWNDGRGEVPKRPPKPPRDGFGFGSRRQDVWRPEAMICTLTRKAGSFRTQTSPLVLWWELDHEMITDDYLPEDADAFELFAEWERVIRRKGAAADADLPIWWFVVGPTICEFAEPSPEFPDGSHFDRYYWLGDEAGAYQIGIDTLPVAAKAWSAEQADKGGFVQQVTQWQPTPLQPTVSLDLLRRRMWARRA